MTPEIQIDTFQDSPSATEYLRRIHELLYSECEHVKEVTEVLELGGEDLRDILEDFPDKEILDCQQRNLLHVTLREIKEDFLAEELCLMFLGSGMSGVMSNRDITQRNASDYAISRSMTRLWEIFQYQPNTDEIRQAFDNHRIAEVKYFSDLLRKAIRENKIELIEEFVMKGADPNQPNKNGFTSLHFAAAKSNNESKFLLMEKLISLGADVNIQDKEGNTALNLFIKRIDEQEQLQSTGNTIELLVLSGTDITLKDMDGKDSKAILKERNMNQFDDALNLKPTKVVERHIIKAAVTRIIVEKKFRNSQNKIDTENKIGDLNSNTLIAENCEDEESKKENENTEKEIKLNSNNNQEESTPNENEDIVDGKINEEEIHPKEEVVETNSTCCIII